MHTTEVAHAVPPAITGGSAAVRRARGILDAPAAGPLLILSDDGLEPEAIARYVHDHTRAAHPFVALDCARPGADALDTALFGARPKIAADLETLGAGSMLLAAKRGTLFLNNIAELPAALQRRLARVLRDGEARLNVQDGVKGNVRIEARVIAAAPPTLPADTRDGRFRAELLRRFGAAVIVPALRERPEDIEAIVARVAADVSAVSHRRAPGFTPAALTMLAAMPWTRNIDEMRLTLARVFRRVTGDTVRQEDLLPAVPFDGLARRIDPGVSLREARRRFEREYIASVLEQHGWRMSDAARTLGIERANLYRKTRELGIQRGAPGERRS